MRLASISQRSTAGRRSAKASPARAASGLSASVQASRAVRAGLALAERLPAVLRWLIEASRIAPDAPLAQPVPAP